jgi:pimeloyl-ACP methyl ester carboxylesterase
LQSSPATDYGSALTFRLWVDQSQLKREVVPVYQAEFETMRGLTNSIVETQSPLVLLLRKGGTKTPLYFISAGPDEPRLAKLMGEDRSIYGVQIRWPADWLQAAKSNDVSLIPRLEEFAGLFVEALHEHLGSARCILAGHSFGGVLAFEVGRQIQMRGGKVDAVVIIDKAARAEDIYGVVLRNLRQSWFGTPADPGRLGGEAFAGRINRFALISWWLLGTAKARIAWAVSPGRGELTTTFDVEGVPLRWPALMRFYRHMHRSYRPTPLDCRGIVIRATGDRYASIRTADAKMGWSGLFTKGVVALELTGVSHNSIIREKAQLLASAITQAISTH